MKCILHMIIALCLILTISACGDNGGTIIPSSTQSNTQVALGVDKSVVVADGIDGVTLTATVTDPTGAPIAGQEVQINVPPTLWFSNIPTALLITDANGQVVLFLKTIFHPQNDVPVMVPQDDITVTCLGMTSAPVRLTINPGPHQITSSVALISDKVQAVADNRDSITFTTTIKDTNGAPIPDQLVHVAVSGGNGYSVIALRYTDINGQATISYQYPPPQLFSPANTVLTMTATSGSVLSNPITVTYTKPITAEVSLVADKLQAVADGTDIIQFTATIKDGNGYPIPYQAINFNVSPGANRYLSPVYTNANGIAVMQLTAPPSSALETIISVSATSGSITSNTVNVTYTALPQVTPNLVTLTSNKTTLIANGSDQVTFTITATDASGNPLVGQLVHLNLPYGPYLSLTQRYTNTLGKASSTISRYVDSTWPVPTSQTTIAITATVNGAYSNAVNITVTPP